MEPERRRQAEQRQRARSEGIEEAGKESLRVNFLQAHEAFTIVGGGDASML